MGSERPEIRQHPGRSQARIVSDGRASSRHITDDTPSTMNTENQRVSASNREAQGRADSSQDVRDRVNRYLQNSRQTPRCPKSSLLLQAAHASAGGFAAASADDGTQGDKPALKGTNELSSTGCVCIRYSIGISSPNSNIRVASLEGLGLARKHFSAAQGDCSALRVPQLRQVHPASG